MSLDSQLRYTDEMLRYIYSSEIFQQLEEKQQYEFLQRQKNNQFFYTMLEVALGLDEVVKEVESLVDSISTDTLQYFKAPRHSIRNKIVITENVYHYPFGTDQKEQGPLYICLQVGDSMEEFLAFCKGMLMPIFEMAQKQKRDLVIVSFAQEIQIYEFVYNRFDILQFEQFIKTYMSGRANLIPALEQVEKHWQQTDVKEDSEVIIVTNNDFADYDAQSYKRVVDKLQQKGISISAIALSETLFDRKPLSFLEKVYFVHE